LTFQFADYQHEYKETIYHDENTVDHESIEMEFEKQEDYIELQVPLPVKGVFHATKEEFTL